MAPTAWTAADDEEAHHYRSHWELAWYRLRRNKAALLGAIIVLLLVVAAVFAPLLAPHDPNQPFDSGMTLDGSPTSPNGTFLLGADTLGRDLLSRILYGARVSLTIGVVANGLAMVIGVAVGLVGGYFKGWVGTAVMRLTDVMMAFPVLLLAIALVAVLKPSLWIVIGVIAFVYWTPIARIVHGQVLTIKEREFVEAALAVGAGQWRIVFRHVLPHLVPVIIVYTTLGIATNVLFEAALSFLGVGVQPPTPSWGAMISDGQNYYRSAPWLVLYPGLAIMLTVLGFSLLGDGLRDALDPAWRD
ncbi:MAG TPA: ABC transporter permease [Chloroflexota bacterium]|nr:ABC transporter permease [Chloroflexota bacterium]